MKKKRGDASTVRTISVHQLHTLRDNETWCFEEGIGFIVTAHPDKPSLIARRINSVAPG